MSNHTTCRVLKKHLIASRQQSDKAVNIYNFRIITCEVSTVAVTAFVGCLALKDTLLRNFIAKQYWLHCFFMYSCSLSTAASGQ